MAVRKRFYIIPFFFVIIGGLLVSSYREVENRVIGDFNQQQLALGKQASNAISELFNQFQDDLHFLAGSQQIQDLNEFGKDRIQNYQELKSRFIKGVTRVNEHGRITYTYPEVKDIIGKDISYQDHIKKIMRSHKDVLSDVFRTVQGYDAIAFHTPVFHEGEFRGSLALVISFEAIAEQYLENIRIADNGYAWVISKEGIELYCPVPNHTGISVHETSKAFPSVIQMAEKMMRGGEGTTIYTYDQIAGTQIKSITKHAAYTPIQLIDTRWSIVVATPESEVLASMTGYRNRWLLLVAIMLGGIAIYILFITRAIRAVRDMEKQKELEAISRENEKNLRNFISNSPIPIAFNNPDTGFLLLNHAFTFATGYDEDDIPNLQDWFTQFLPSPEEISELNAHLDQSVSISANPDIQPSTVKITCKSGAVKTFEYRYSRFASRHSLTLNDITEKLEAESNRKKLEDQLSRAKKMEALGLLAGGVAHDLNNILSGVVTYPELILMNLDANSPLRKPVNSIMTAGKRAAAVVQDLLTLTRGAAYKGVSFSPSKLLSNMSDEIQNLIPDLDKDMINIQWALSSTSPTLLGSEHHLRKTLSNLILNAYEALNHRGTIRVSCKTEQLTFPLEGYETVPPGTYCLIEVDDDGPGIQQSDLERIFEPFFSKKVMGRSGSGLGLMVVWNTVKEFEGFIDIKTSEKGTSFKLYLPGSSKGSAPSISEPEQELVVGNNRKILIVDDDDSQREISSELLTTLGFKPSAVDNGREAIEQATTQNFDMILLDMVLEDDIDGSVIYQHILEKKPNQRAIIVSGFSETQNVRTALDLGADSFLKKPYSIAELSQALKAAFEET